MALILISIALYVSELASLRVFLSILAENKRTCVYFIRLFLIEYTCSIYVLPNNLSASSSTIVLTSCTLSFLMLINWYTLAGVPTNIAGLCFNASSCLLIFPSPVTNIDE